MVELRTLSTNRSTIAALPETLGEFKTLPLTGSQAETLVASTAVHVGRIPYRP